VEAKGRESLLLVLSFVTLLSLFLVCPLPYRNEYPANSLADEATSALDVTSRSLVFAAIKAWRVNKTTIVITHDLSQIEQTDFVYVLKNGTVVEQGFRVDLESAELQGEFRAMMEAQHQTGGYLPEKPLTEDDEKVEELFKDEEDNSAAKKATKHKSIATANALRPLTMSSWMFDVVADLTRTTTVPAPAALTHSEPARVSRFEPVEPFPSFDAPRPRKRSSIQELPSLAVRPPSPAMTISTRRFSLQFTPSSPTFTFTNPFTTLADDEDSSDDEKASIKRVEIASRRPARHIRNRWDAASMPMEVKEIDIEAQPEQRQLPIWRLIRAVYPTVPYKFVIALGLIFCIASGAMTPIFSFLLSRLLYEVSIGAGNIRLINLYGGLVLGAAALDGLLMGLKFFTMETTGMVWIQRLRKIAFSRVLSQDKKWFDKADNSAIRMVQVIVKDGDDTRDLIGIVLSQFVVVFTMLSVGLIWALIAGWQLTLVGFAIAPFFAVAMAVQTKLVAQCELRNKRAREDVAKGYYEVCDSPLFVLPLA
jgi:ATP-binding cassette subfamily B (MDR/TAP) protein 1